MKAVSPNKNEPGFPKTIIEPIRHMVENKDIGVSFDDVLCQLEITEDDYHTTTFTLSADKYLALHRWIKRQSHDGVGLTDWLSHFSATSAGLAGLAVLSSGSIREATSIASRYLPLYVPGMKGELLLDENFARFSVEMVIDLKELNNFLIEAVTGVICIIADQMTTDRIPHSIHFKHSAKSVGNGDPEKLTELESLLGGKIYFDSYFNGIEGKLQYLDEKSRSPNEATLDTVKQLLDNELAELESEQAFSVVAKQKLNELAKQGSFPSLEEFADQLNISSRTLVRKLANEETTFKTVSNEVRLKMATELLRKNNLSIKQVAAKTGFNSVNSFGRAFKSLTNETPLEWKKNQFSQKKA